MATTSAGQIRSYAELQYKGTTVTPSKIRIKKKSPPLAPSPTNNPNLDTLSNSDRHSDGHRDTNLDAHS